MKIDSPSDRLASVDRNSPGTPARPEVKGRFPHLGEATVRPGARSDLKPEMLRPLDQRSASPSQAQVKQLFTGATATLLKGLPAKYMNVLSGTRVRDSM